jgi:hypothetical protein
MRVIHCTGRQTLAAAGGPHSQPKSESDAAFRLCLLWVGGEPLRQSFRSAARPLKLKLISPANDRTIGSDASGPVDSGGATNSTGSHDNCRSRNGSGPTHNRSPVGSHASGPHNSSSANDSMSAWGQSEPTKCQYDGQCDAFHLRILQPDAVPISSGDTCAAKIDRSAQESHGVSRLRVKRDIPLLTAKRLREFATRKAFLISEGVYRQKASAAASFLTGRSEANTGRSRRTACRRR